MEELRAENAEHRTKAKRADELASGLLVATVQAVTRGILADPTDLAPSEDLYGEDGFPDPEKITEAHGHWSSGSPILVIDALPRRWSKAPEDRFRT